MVRRTIRMLVAESSPGFLSPPDWSNEVEYWDQEVGCAAEQLKAAVKKSA
jgi:hypothetical protein